MFHDSFEEISKRIRSNIKKLGRSRWILKENWKEKEKNCSRGNSRGSLERRVAFNKSFNNNMKLSPYHPAACYPASGQKIIHSRCTRQLDRFISTRSGQLLTLARLQTLSRTRKARASVASLNPIKGWIASYCRRQVLGRTSRPRSRSGGNKTWNQPLIIINAYQTNRCSSNPATVGQIRIFGTRPVGVIRLFWKASGALVRKTEEVEDTRCGWIGREDFSGWIWNDEIWGWNLGVSFFHTVWWIDGRFAGQFQRERIWYERCRNSSSGKIIFGIENIEVRIRFQWSEKEFRELDIIFWNCTEIETSENRETFCSLSVILFVTCPSKGETYMFLN